MSETVECWLPIPGFVGYYEVSTFGRVKSLARIVPRSKMGPLRIKERILKGSLHPFGYRVHVLHGGGVKGTFFAHHLVLLAFVGPKPAGMEIRHLDGDATRSRLDNLAYGTHAENMQDAIRHGTNASLRKTHCPQNHEYTEENTYRYPSGRRGCKICLEAKGRSWRENNPDRKRELDATYHATHREEANARRAQYDVEHRERQKAYNKAYREANRERLLAQSRAAHQAHKEERNAQRAQWTKDHAEHNREYHREYDRAHKKPKPE